MKRLRWKVLSFIDLATRNKERVREREIEKKYLSDDCQVDWKNIIQKATASGPTCCFWLECFVIDADEVELTEHWNKIAALKWSEK